MSVERGGPPSAHGAALVDLVVSCALVGVVAAIAVPAYQANAAQDAARSAARHLADRLDLIRVEALRRNATVALRFDPVDLGRFRPYVDGDGDGVLQADVDRGIDRPLTADLRLADHFADVRLRIRSEVPDPDGSGTLVAGSDPLRLGASNFLSYSPIGSATSGTIYLAAATGPQMAVRVMGATGRLRVLVFDPVRQQWRED